MRRSSRIASELESYGHVPANGGTWSSLLEDFITFLRMVQEHYGYLIQVRFKWRFKILFITARPSVNITLGKVIGWLLDWLETEEGEGSTVTVEFNNADEQTLY